MTDCDDNNRLSAQTISYRAAKRTLVDRLSVTLEPGEMVALIGPNGAGKSTLMRLLSGYLAPHDGQCVLHGQSLTAWSRQALARHRAVMRQQQHITFALSVRDIVAMGRAPWPERDTQRIVRQVLALTDCTSLAGRDFRQLSGGEQQRVQLARALAQLWQDEGPRGWLFLDEPTSALDLYHQQQALRLLHRLTRQGALSVCCILHDLNLAALWADRMILMHSGKLVACDTPAEVMTAPLLTRWYQADLHIYSHPQERVPQVALRR
ncbi:heme ABC transporter ATP-binding protein [Erwinia sp. OLTSP20]|uniref:heme ABC transporter ATP-binding protein n=1 Tax=unclassified Erwinia TaxID=2622719 RepID=UPI000C18D93E|nr:MULTISPECIES: heme ABC transporter ATP-binding protein [unclassified Erwinia]PIJ50239.1 heme ABC transporter ATP-binding protein [Erwinia sp. OAMSP11]PIJ72077.1 heme ABC transporter ATP-binding protein [Erwinia sp. OLSSP12]PIJ81368.1 heme ABC transporter ATP-binding protein [Erwinia sp. OLCASP19]PIJ84074.1 heme ABC transporter ATP-binding protein [Erwinia sp. OLMTSP26]PIJ85773.1 heme ABC transporter ATP-binding protein [Erwinia sp. OLMDSP33]